MRRFVLAVMWSLAALPASAGGLQDRYNAGEQALQAGDYKTAVATLSDVLEHLAPSQREGRAAALIHARLGRAEFELGNNAAATGHFERALAGLGTESAEDRFESAYVHLYLGLLGELAIDYPAAVRHFELARQLDNRPETMRVTDVPLARVKMFSDPATARRLLDGAIARKEADERVKGETLGQLYALRGRVELNAGDAPAAIDWFQKALKSAGGLGTRVTLADIRIRSDLSIAYSLAKRKAGALRILSYTGAGRLGDKTVPFGNGFELPECAPLTNIQPEDMVILELTINNEGRVAAAIPIYSTRSGIIEETFARTALQWRWWPKQLEDVPIFWRAAIRVELRCASPGSDRRSVFEPYREETQAFMFHGQRPEPQESGFDRAAALMKELSRREEAHGQNARELAPILFALATSPTVNQRDSLIYLDRAIAIASRDGLTERQRGLLTLLRLEMLDEREGRSGLEAMAGRRDAGLGDLPQLAGIWLGRDWETDHKPEKAIAEYRRVADSTLADDHLLKRFALLRLASLSFEMKQPAQAEAYLRRSGLKPNQCSLVDATPLVDNQGIGSSDYPEDLMYTGFNGSVKANFDITTDGRTVAPRVVFAYPPFIFDETVIRGAARMRFKPIYRETGTLGCTGLVQGYSFVIRH